MSDIHLHAMRDYERLWVYAEHTDCSHNFRLALQEMKALSPAPQLLLLGGDIADSGCGGEAPGDEYDDLKHILDEELPASIPSLFLLGNHDHADAELSANWHEAFGSAARKNWPAPVERSDYYYEARLLGWRFIMLDSRQGQPISQRQREWLAQRFKEDDTTPTIVGVHRPFTCCGNWVDNHRLQDRKTFDLIDASRSVKAILSGHTHKSAGWRFRKKVHVIFPALAYGIDETCGWGVLVVNPQGVQSVFIKELAAPTYDQVACDFRERAGRFYQLPLNLFEASPLCDPCTMPRRSPKEWD